MKIVKRVLLGLVLVLIVAVVYNYPKLNMVSGFASKNMASSAFVGGRSEQSVNQNDHNVPLIKLAESHYNENDTTASATVFGLMERKTICREGLGCVLINEGYNTSQKLLKPRRTVHENGMPFPYGNHGIQDTLFDNIDYDQLDEAIAGAFDTNDKQKTRTVLVAYKGHIIGEKYLEGFSSETPILGWSMTKSIIVTLYGILKYQGKIDMEYRPFAEDIRMKNTKIGITLNHLLRMQSGLAWDEDYASISDVTEMLFLDADMTAKQAANPVIAKPTEVWNYSSGTSNLLSGILRKQFKTHQEYLDFPYTELIDKIGMHSMLIETDMAGNFVGSSYGWASTRDWAKFGLLHLNKGHWNGQQLFNPQWIEYITTPTKNSEGVYGAHWWLNAGGKYPDVPRDMYSANGFQGQRVFIIPSKDLVVVRTGLAEDPDFDINGFLSGVVAAIK